MKQKTKYNEVDLNNELWMFKKAGGDFLKITIEDLSPKEEEEIIVRCHSLDKDLLRLLEKLKTKESCLFGYVREIAYRINYEDAYYFESVDNKVFLYCKKQVFETKYKLYQVEEDYNNGDFLRISKSIVVNISKINNIRPAFNGRFEAELDNGEKVIISRQYVSDLKRKLGM